MLLTRRKLKIETERLTLRPPNHSDFRAWTSLRRESQDYLVQWEPTWAHDHLTRKAFTNRVYWAQRSVAAGSAMPLFLFRREDEVLIGAITLDNIRRGPSQAGTLGYWTGKPFSRQGFMREAIGGVVHFAFTRLDLRLGRGGGLRLRSWLLCGGRFFCGGRFRLRGRFGLRFGFLSRFRFRWSGQLLVRRFLRFLGCGLFNPLCFGSSGRLRSVRVNFRCGEGSGD